MKKIYFGIYQINPYEFFALFFPKFSNSSSYQYFRFSSLFLSFGFPPNLKFKSSFVDRYLSLFLYVHEFYLEKYI